MLGPNYGQNGKENLSENGGVVIFIFGKYGNGELVMLIIIVCNVNAIAGTKEKYIYIYIYIHCFVHKCTVLEVERLTWPYEENEIKVEIDG